MKSHDVRRSIQVSAAGEMDVIWYLADIDRNQSGKLSSMNHAGISLPPRLCCWDGNPMGFPVFLYRSGVHRLNLCLPDAASVLVVFPSWWLLSGSLK